MLINDKRENDGMLPVENISNGNCFLHNNVLYVKTNMPAWIEPYEASSICVCVRLDTGKLARLNKQIKVTPINVECNMINQTQHKTKEDLTKSTKEISPTLKNKNIPEPIKEMFPDWETIRKGEWSTHGIIFKTTDDTCIEIGLYREPDTDTINSGTLTLQIFENDKIILCEQVSE